MKMENNRLKNIPKLRGTHVLKALMNFYEDIGWDRKKLLDPRKFKMNKKDLGDLFDKIVKIGEKEGMHQADIHFLMINKGPSGDDSVPKGKVLWEE